MKFFLIVSFLMTSVEIERPMYVFKSPSFETEKDICSIKEILELID